MATYGSMVGLQSHRSLEIGTCIMVINFVSAFEKHGSCFSVGPGRTELQHKIYKLQMLVTIMLFTDPESFI